MAALDDFLSFLQGASNSAASAVSAPVDGINWALGKVGVPVSKKPVGGSEWLKELGFTAEPKNKTAGLLGEAVGGVLPIVAQAKAPQIAAGINQMISNAQAPRTLNPQTGAIVWHGSPHKFDKFDSSKIGTGEGAQAYGHGLYFAESPDVANEYRKQLSTKFQSGGLKFDGQANTRLGTTGNSLLDDYLVANLGDVNATRNQMLQDVADIRKNNPQGAKEWQQALADLRKARAITKQTETGALYKVDLPDDAIAKMLDWDKPLSQQAPEVQRFFSDVSRPPGADMPVGEWLKPRFAEGAAPYWSDDMRKVGIPGIRYLDGGSRGVGQGTSNFVVFPGNEGLLSILERNGQPLR